MKEDKHEQDMMSLDGNYCTNFNMLKMMSEVTIINYKLDRVIEILETKCNLNNEVVK